MITSGQRQIADKLSKIEMTHFLRYRLADRFLTTEDNVLDFGCGSGYGSYYLTINNKINVVAIDNDLEAISLANNYYPHPNIEYRLSSTVSECLYFDIAICFEVIEHVQAPDEIMEELYKAIRNEGKIILSTPNENVMPYSKDKFPFHIRHFKPEEFLKLIHDHDLVVEKKYFQKSKKAPYPLSGWDGAFMIAICRKK